MPVGERRIIKHRWRVGGKIRFQGASAFDSARIENNLGRVFECDEPEPRLNWLQMCCKRRLPKPVSPECFLFCVRSERIGWMNFKSHAVKSADTLLLSYSLEGSDQEALLLMTANSWIEGRNGRFFVHPDPRRPWRARLRISEL